MNRVTLFGEVLFDCLPSGEEILGGAPFNVAWNLAGFGEAPLMISRVGEDERGRSVLSTMKQWGMDTSAMQVDSRFPTGIAKISLDDGHAGFDLVPEQAYDYIQSDSVSPSALEGILYHGTLALRSGVSRDSLLSIRDQKALSTFVDLNLRAPWWSREKFSEYLKDIRWLKINDEELSIMLDTPLNSRSEQIAGASKLAQDYSIEQIIVTCGEDGAFVADATSQLAEVKPPQLSKVVDTVGAGDAFASVFITGLLHQWDLSSTLERAVHFAASICEIPGATATDLSLYQSHKETWS